MLSKRYNLIFYFIVAIVIAYFSAKGQPFEAKHLNELIHLTRQIRRPCEQSKCLYLGVGGSIFLVQDSLSINEGTPWLEKLKNQYHLQNYKLLSLKDYPLVQKALEDQSYDYYRKYIKYNLTIARKYEGQSRFYKRSKYFEIKQDQIINQLLNPNSEYRNDPKALKDIAPDFINICDYNLRAK